MEAETRDGRRDAANRLLALVADLGNVSEACRRMGLDRSAYYRILRATQGGALPAQAEKRRRNALPEGMDEAVLGLCRRYPEWGCDRLAYYLTLTGSPVSSPTVQKILIRNSLGRVAQRVAEAERLRSADPKGS